MKLKFTLLVLLVSKLLMAQIPTLGVTNNGKNQHLEISQLSVDINIVGNIAITTYDIVFFNPLGLDLEGEFSMPLSEGQEVCRYALDINGNMREGVLIEKVKARQTFEAVVRKNIDPGIASKTKGNFFKTRIYPIPSYGSKRVIIAMSETLIGDSDNLYYSLPMKDSASIGQFKLNVKIFKGSVKENIPQSDYSDLVFDKQDDVYCMTFDRNDFVPTKSMKFTIPRFSKNNHQLYTCDFAGDTYFYLNVKSPKLIKSQKKTPKRISMYWDNSLSADKRNIDKELDFLERYLKSIKGKKKLSITVFNEAIEDTKHFTVRNDISEIITYLRSFHNDGATCLECLKLDTLSDEILLFSDVINTLGSEDVITSKTPVYTISSSSGSNYSLLKKIATNTNGEFINLESLSLDKALDIMKYDEEKFLSCDYNNSDLFDVYPNTPKRVGEYLEIVGKLKTSKALLKLNFGDKSSVTKTLSFNINKQKSTPVARIWASKKIEALDLNYKDNKDEIIDLSRKYGIVSRNMSFIVLDRLSDYVEHEILPPLELQADYHKMQDLNKKKKIDALNNINERNIKRFKRLADWYDCPQMPRLRKKHALEEEMVAVTVQDTPPPPPAPQANDVIHISERDEDFDDELEIEDVEADYENLAFDDVKNSIKVMAWEPDSEDMKQIKRTPIDSFDDLYFKLKKKNRDRPSYYIEVSDYLFKKNLKKKAVRILSNVLELDLENPELLKTVARRLIDENEYNLAIKILNEIKDLRPEEPQSYRDLALAYVGNKQYSKAIDMYKHIIDNDWGRFEDIKDVVFNELNSLLVLHEKDIEIARIDTTYIKKMPLNVRLTIDWSSNNNDIDLWVVDPNGEKCMYNHKHTKMGGKMSTDFTRGYGPEEFSLKNAKRGVYTVYINYYSPNRQKISGPVMVYATLYTNYGTPDQDSKVIAIPLKNRKETKQIGILEF